MSPLSKIGFRIWQAEELKDPEFVAAANDLEPGYLVAMLRIRRGLTQARLAEMVSVREATIAGWRVTIAFRATLSNSGSQVL